MSFTAQGITLVCYTEKPTARLDYVLQELIRYSPITAAIIISDYALAITNLSQCKIWYSSEPAPEEWIHIIPAGLLEAKASNKPMSIRFIDELPVFYYNEQTSDGQIQADWLSIIFFCLSRLEEYRAELDIYGRFQAKDAFGSKAKILNLPIVDLLKTRLLSSWFGKDFKLTHTEKDVLSVDIDMAYAWKFKPLFLIFYHLIKSIADGNVSLVKEILHTRFKFREDPYDTTSFFLDLSAKTGVGILFFILCGKRSKLDRNMPLQHPAMQTLIKKLANKSSIGLHPSSGSNQSLAILKEEKRNLEATTGTSITSSRQHYLIMEMPRTYASLLESGITEDHSMIFHDSPGYRAGTALPFQWYNIEQECKTDLKIVPYQLMDVTLKNYLKLSPEAAGKLIKDMRREAHQLGLPFKVIWHNSSLSTSLFWQGWTEVINTIFESHPKSQ